MTSAEKKIFVGKISLEDILPGLKRSGEQLPLQAQFQQEKLTRADIVALIKEAKKQSKHINLSNKDLSGLKLDKLDLSYGIFEHTNFSGASCIKTKFNHADLSSADCSNMIASKAKFILTRIMDANFDYAYLANAIFTIDEDTRGAKFRHADLHHAKFIGKAEKPVHFEADFDYARLYETVFWNVDLRDVKNLFRDVNSRTVIFFDTIKFYSNIDLDPNQKAVIKKAHEHAKMTEGDFNKKYYY